MPVNWREFKTSDMLRVEETKLSGADLRKWLLDVGGPQNEVSRTEIARRLGVPEKTLVGWMRQLRLGWRASIVDLTTLEVTEGDD
jgi:transposase-like protein